MTYGIKVINDYNGATIDGFNPQLVFVSRQTARCIGIDQKQFRGTISYTPEAVTGSALVNPICFFSNPYLENPSHVNTCVGFSQFTTLMGTANGFSYYQAGFLLRSTIHDFSHTWLMDVYVFDVISSVAPARLVGSENNGLEIYSSRVVNGTNKIFSSSSVPLLISGYGVTNGTNSLTLAQGSIPSKPAWTFGRLGAGFDLYGAKNAIYGIAPTTSGNTVSIATYWYTGPYAVSTTVYQPNQYVMVIDGAQYD